MTQQYPDWRGGIGQYQNPWGGIGMYQYPNSGRPGDNPNYSTLNPQAPINPFMPNFGNPFGGLSQLGRMSPDQIAQMLGWGQRGGPTQTPTPTMRPQSQAPFSDYPGWNMQGAPTLNPQPFNGGSAWAPGSAQGRPASWNVATSSQMGPPSPPLPPPPWQYSQYDPNNPGGVPQGMWTDQGFITYTDYRDAVDARAREQQQQGIQNGQWQQTFGANQAQNAIGNSQWDRTFGANQAQQGVQNNQWDRTFNANQAQQAIGNNQWDRTFGANQAQQGWQNQFNTTEAQRAADQWGQTFGANQAQNAWNNQYQTGRANAADSQWGQQFDRSGNQWNQEFARNTALDQWNQAFQNANFDWSKQQDTEHNRLTDQGQNLAAFGRRFGPNVAYM